MRTILKDPRLVALSTALACFGIVLFSPGIFNDGDTYWHIAAGRWMLDNHAVLRIDPFSYTFAGQPWQTHEWLAESAIALAYVGLGWTGVAFLFAAVFALTGGLLAWHLGKTLGGLSLVATVALSLSLVAGGLLTRPHILALLPLEIWAAGLIFARDRGHSPSFKLLPVMALWANLHGGFAFGLALIVPFALEAGAQGGWRGKEFRGWGAFFVLALAAAMVTPYGAETLCFPFRLMGMGELYKISEWMPAKLTGLQPLPLTVGAALFVLLSRGGKIVPLRLAVLLGLLYLSLIQARHTLLLAVVGPLLLAGPLSAALGNASRRGRPVLSTLVAFLAGVSILSAVRVAYPIAGIRNAMTPAAALAHIPVAVVHSPVLNDYGFGGYLIFNDIRPFIDGRAELYGQDFLKTYDRVTQPDGRALGAALATYRIGWTIFSPDNPAVIAMDRMRGWHRLYADKVAVVHVRNDRHDR